MIRVWVCLQCSRACALVFDGRHQLRGSACCLAMVRTVGRRGIGIELSPAYAEMARQRIISDKPLLNATTEGGWL